MGFDKKGKLEDASKKGAKGARERTDRPDEDKRSGNDSSAKKRTEIPMAKKPQA